MTHHPTPDPEPLASTEDGERRDTALDRAASPDAATPPPLADTTTTVTASMPIDHRARLDDRSGTSTAPDGEATPRSTDRASSDPPPDPTAPIDRSRHGAVAGPPLPAAVDAARSTPLPADQSFDPPSPRAREQAGDAGGPPPAPTAADGAGADTSWTPVDRAAAAPPPSIRPAWLDRPLGVGLPLPPRSQTARQTPSDTTIDGAPSPASNREDPTGDPDLADRSGWEADVAPTATFNPVTPAPPVAVDRVPTFEPDGAETPIWGEPIVERPPPVDRSPLPPPASMATPFGVEYRGPSVFREPSTEPPAAPETEQTDDRNKQEREMERALRQQLLLERERRGLGWP